MEAHNAARDSIYFPKFSSVNENKDKMWVQKSIYLWTASTIKKQRDFTVVVLSAGSWSREFQDVLPLVTERGWTAEECFPYNSVISIFGIFFPLAAEAAIKSTWGVHKPPLGEWIISPHARMKSISWEDVKIPLFPGLARAAAHKTQTQGAIMPGELCCSEVPRGSWMCSALQSVNKNLWTLQQSSSAPTPDLPAGSTFPGVSSGIGVQHFRGMEQESPPSPRVYFKIT